MKDKLIDIITYLYKVYPNQQELSKTRLIKLIYLIDWKNCLQYEVQLTQINWRFDHYGPYVEDVMNIIYEKNNFFGVEEYTNAYGGRSIRVKLIDKKYKPDLSKKEIEVINFIINKTSPLNFNELINLVYSTYPIKSNPKYSNLDLVEEAKQYKRIKSSIH